MFVMAFFLFFFYLFDFTVLSFWFLAVAQAGLRQLLSARKCSLSPDPEGEGIRGMHPAPAYSIFTREKYRLSL